MNAQERDQLHENFSDLHDQLQGAPPEVHQALGTIVKHQTSLLQRIRQHLSNAKRGTPNVDLTGIEQGLMDLGYHNQALASLNGPKQNFKASVTLSVHHPDWPLDGNEPLPAAPAGLAVPLSDHNRAVTEKANG